MITQNAQKIKHSIVNNLLLATETGHLKLLCTTNASAMLTDEANKRYATTKNQLAMLKNKAVLFAQTLGDDMLPVLQGVMDGASATAFRLSSFSSRLSTSL